MSRVATQNTRFQLRNGGTGEPVQRNQFAAEQWGAFTYVFYTWGILLTVELLKFDSEIMMICVFIYSYLKSSWSKSFNIHKHIFRELGTY